MADTVAGLVAEIGKVAEKLRVARRKLGAAEYTGVMKNIEERQKTVAGLEEDLRKLRARLGKLS